MNDIRVFSSAGEAIQWKEDINDENIHVYVILSEFTSGTLVPMIYNFTQLADNYISYVDNE